jgi:predicted GNAT family acetyltransferase
MFDVKLQLSEDGKGAFKLMDGDQEAGEMVVGVVGANMRVYHTEVDREYEGQGLAKKLLEAMVLYARQQHLKVTPLCQYVHAQFKRHPDQFSDIWNR